jgi:hypothetical protein
MATIMHWWLDGQAFGQPWPFNIAEIKAPIHIFHGDSDSLAPLPVLRRSLAPGSTPAGGAPLPWRQPLRSLGHAGTPDRYARRHPRLMTHPGKSSLTESRTG